VNATSSLPVVSDVDLEYEALASGGRRRRPVVALLAAAALVLLVLASFIGPHFLPSSSAIDLTATVKPPGYTSLSGTTYLLGTDELGRDEFVRALIGVRTSLEIALLAILVGGTFGSAAGMIGGYLGGAVDELVMRLVDIQMSVPAVLLIVVVVAVAKPSFLVIVLVLGLAIWMVFARVARAQVLSLKEQEMILAIRSLGASTPRTLFRHVLPNIAPPLLVVFTLQIATLITAEAALDYLGLGVPPPTPTLGSMISEGQGILTTGAWWPVVVPGAAIVIIIVSVTILGDWLRDRLDPRARARA
jgi:peptide/nickel transport system permease protein